MNKKELLEKWIEVNKQLQHKLVEYDLLKKEKKQLEVNNSGEVFFDKMKDIIVRCESLSKEIKKLKMEASRLKNLSE